MKKRNPEPNGPLPEDSAPMAMFYSYLEIITTRKWQKGGQIKSKHVCKPPLPSGQCYYLMVRKLSQQLGFFSYNFMYF